MHGSGASDGPAAVLGAGANDGPVPNCPRRLPPTARGHLSCAFLRVGNPVVLGGSHAFPTSHEARALTLGAHPRVAGGERFFDGLFQKGARVSQVCSAAVIAPLDQGADAKGHGRGVAGALHAWATRTCRALPLRIPDSVSPPITLVQFAQLGTELSESEEGGSGHTLREAMRNTVQLYTATMTLGGQPPHLQSSQPADAKVRGAGAIRADLSRTTRPPPAPRADDPFLDGERGTSGSVDPLRCPFCHTASTQQTSQVADPPSLPYMALQPDVKKAWGEDAHVKVGDHEGEGDKPGGAAEDESADRVLVRDAQHKGSAPTAPSVEDTIPSRGQEEEEEEGSEDDEDEDASGGGARDGDHPLVLARPPSAGSFASDAFETGSTGEASMGAGPTRGVGREGGQPSVAQRLQQFCEEDEGDSWEDMDIEDPVRAESALAHARKDSRSSMGDAVGDAAGDAIADAVFDDLDFTADAERDVLARRAADMRRYLARVRLGENRDVAVGALHSLSDLLWDHPSLGDELVRHHGAWRGKGGGGPAPPIPTCSPSRVISVP